jgi:hypothetical protein
MDGEPLFAGDSDLDQLYRIQTLLGPVTPDQVCCGITTGSLHAISGNQLKQPWEALRCLKKNEHFGPHQLPQ